MQQWSKQRLTDFILSESQDVTHQHGATGAGGAQAQGSLLPLLAVRRRRGLLQGPQVAEGSGTCEAGEQHESGRTGSLSSWFGSRDNVPLCENHVINLAQACVGTAEM